MSRFQELIETLRTPVLVRWAAGALVCALTLLTGTCRVGDLTNPPPPLGKLAVSPAAVVDSAAVGSAARRSWTVAISNAGQGVLSWTAHADGSAWVGVSPMSGTAPGTVTIVLDPATLGMGVYRDTVMLSADGAVNSPVPLAIELHVRPCATAAVAPDVAVSDSLRTSDCSAPHRTGHFAQLYSFDGASGDSITIALASPAFGPYVVLDSSMAATAPPLAEGASCPGQTGACLSYVRLPRAGTYVVEATSVNAGQIGAYSLSVTLPHAPQLPDSLRQLRSDSLTATPVGGAVDQATVVVGGALSDPNAQDTLRLEVEVRPVGTAFTGTPTASSARVSNGRRALVAVAGLSNNTSYHWQGRTVDQTGRRSGWSAFGGNPESDADFTVAIPQPPNAPTGAAQFKADGVTSLALGGTTDQLSTVFKGLVTDPNPADQLRLDVEVEPVGTAFANTPSGTGVPAANGGTATATVAGLVDNTAYHWQARTADQTGLVSPWVSFGGNPEADADFRVAIAPTQLGFTVQPGNTTAGTAITPAVQVTAEDAAGHAVQSFAGSVTIALGANPAGTLSGTTTVAAVAGVARFSNLSVDKVGTGYTLQAGVGTLTTTSTPFTVTPGAAVQLAFTVEPGTATAGGAIAPAVRVAALDAQGNIATGFSGSVTVAIGSNPVGGTLSGSVTVAAASGVATFANLIIDKAGAGYTLVAAAAGAGGGGGPASAASSLFNVASGSAAKLVVTVQPGATAAGAVITPAVRVTAQDAQGNTATGFAGAVTVTIGNNPGNGTLSGAASVAAVAGVATFADLSINKAGVGYTLAASATGLTGAGSAPFNVTPGAATQLTFSVQPGNTTAGAALTPAVAVTAQDAQGNVATSFTGTVTIGLGPNPSGATLAGTLNETASAGVATFGNLSINKTGTYTLAASATGPSGATSTSFTVAPAQATRLVFTVQPSNATAGSAIAPAVQVTNQDTLGNTVSSFTGSVTVALGDNPSGGTLSGTLTVTASSGVATFSSLSVNKVGTGYTLAATTSGSAAGASAPFSVSPGTATQVAFTAQPSNATAGATITPAVQVTAQDAQGNTATSFVGAVTATIGNNPGAGTLSGTATVTAVAGVATFADLSINKAGAGYTLQATSGGLAATSAPFTIMSGAATTLTLTTQPAATAQSGVPFASQPVVQLMDGSGNPVSQAGVTVTAAIATGAGALGGTVTATTTGSGVASFTDLAISGAVGDRTLRFTASGLTDVVSGTITIAAGAATQLALMTQPSAMAQSGVPFAQQPVVQLQDGSGNAVSQANVTVTAVITGAPPGVTLSGATATTNPSGVAPFTGLTITGLMGNYTLSVGSGALTGATSGTVALSAGLATQLTLSIQPAATAQAGVALSPQPVLQLRDVSGNAVSQAGVAVTAAIATGAGTLGGTLTATTTASGAASFTDLAISGAAGDRTLRFTVSGLTEAVSGTITITAGAATQLALMTQPSATAQSGVPFAQQPVVQLQDGSGNPVSQADVTVTAAITGAPPGVTLSGATGTTNASGVAPFTGLTIAGPVGNYTLSFGSGTLTGTTSGITLSAGLATQLTITTQPAATAQSGALLNPQPVLQLLDASGNAVSQPNVTVTAAIMGAPTGVTLSGASATTDATGLASFTALAFTGQAGTYTLSFGSGTLTGTTSSAIALSAGSATQLTLSTQPAATAQAGVALSQQPVVQLRDASGNAVSQANVTVTAAITGTPPGVTLSGATTTTNPSGVATFTGLTIAGPVGNYTLTFGSGTLTGTTSGAIALSAGLATQLSFAVPPTTVMAGQAIAPAVQVSALDAFNNVATTFSDAVTLAIASATGTSGAALHGTPTVSPVAGVATFANVSVDSAGTGYQLTASATGLPGVTSTAFANVAGPAASLSFTAQPSNIEAGAMMAPGVHVTARDAAGNRATSFAGNVSVALGTPNPNRGKLYGTTAAVATGGVAVFSDLTVDSAATGYTLQALSSSLSGPPSNPFNVALPLVAPVVLSGAGDIAECGATPGKQAATAALLDAIPGTVFAAGDQAYPSGTLTDYQTCYDPAWGRHKARTRPAPGNHDYVTPGAPGYFAYFGVAATGDSGKYYYSYDLGTWHIISLNGEISTSAGSAQEGWLKTDLATHPSQCTLAYIHRPRFSAGHHGSNGFMHAIWKDLYSAGAEIYIAGHNHDYERFAPQNADSLGVADPVRGIREFVVGTGGAAAEAWSTPPPLANEEVWANPTWGVLKLTLYAATYTWEFVPIAGQTFTDSGSGICH